MSNTSFWYPPQPDLMPSGRVVVVPNDLSREVPNPWEQNERSHSIFSVRWTPLESKSYSTNRIAMAGSSACTLGQFQLDQAYLMSYAESSYLAELRTDDSSVPRCRHIKDKASRVLTKALRKRLISSNPEKRCSDSISHSWVAYTGTSTQKLKKSETKLLSLFFTVWNAGRMRKKRAIRYQTTAAYQYSNLVRYMYRIHIQHWGNEKITTKWFKNKSNRLLPELVAEIDLRKPRNKVKI